MPLTTTSAKTRYVATFEPQAWQNDYANPVDPEGETSWDCTKFVTRPPKWLREGVTEFYFIELKTEGAMLDTDDIFKCDPAAPKWVREWKGPFTITVERVRERPKKKSKKVAT